MKALQLIYTSCRKGLLGAGFQTCSMSEGITDDERREIEQYGLYIPANDLPSQPTPEQIESLFPVSLIFFRLKSGRYGICQSKYVGQDYTGRYGNYFCHALILEDKNGYWPFYPIELWSSPIFEDRLPEKEIEDIKPQPLLPIDLEKVSSNKSISFDSVKDFINEKSRIEKLKDILSAIFLFEKSHRKLIISDIHQNIPYWIGAIQMAFPIRLAHNLTFTTYTYDPEGMNVLISSTPRNGCRFAFSETQRDFEYYIFDFIQNQRSRVESSFRFNEIADMGYSISEENLITFHKFIMKFDYSSVNEEIDAAYNLFLVYNSANIENIERDQLVDAVKFANDYSSDEVLGDLSEKIDQIADNIINNVNYNTAKVITEFLFKVARRTESPPNLGTAYSFFFNALNHLIIELVEEDPIAPILQFNDNIILLNIKYSDELLSALLDSKLIENLNILLSDDDIITHAEACLILIINNLIKLRCTWKQAIETSNFKPFIYRCFKSLIRSKTKLKSALKSTDNDINFFSQLIASGIETTKRLPNKKSLLLECFTDALKEKSDEWGLNVRTHLIDLGYDFFIYDELCLLMDRAKNRPKFFWAYYDSIFSKIPNFYQKYFSKAVDIYIDSIKGKQLLTESRKLLAHVKVITDDSVLEKIIYEVESSIPIPCPLKDKEDIYDLSKIKNQRKIKTSPDITGLVNLAMEIETKSDSEKISISKLFGKNTPDLKGITRERYKKFLRWTMPGLISISNSLKAHEKIFNFLLVSNFEEDLIAIYIKNIKLFQKKNKKEADKILEDALLNYLYLMSNKKDNSKKRLSDLMKEKLLKILGKLTEEQLKSLDSKVKRRKKLGNRSTCNDWNELREEVKKKSGKPFLKAIFSRITRNK